MKRNSIYIALLAVVLNVSCNKYLEVNPDMRAELNTTAKIREVLTNAYSKASYAVFTEAASDNAADKGLERPEDPVNANPWKFLPVNSKDLDSPTFYWNQTYRAIAAANVAIEAYNNLPTKDQNDPSILGEAYVARAFNHFMLVSLYAKMYDPATADSDPGIPYVTDAGKTVITKYERKTVKYVYEQIEKDLLAGLPLIDDSKYKVAKYHFNRAAANAFATRFYLFKQDYQKAVEYGQATLGENVKDYLRPLNGIAFRSLEYYDKAIYFSTTTNPTNLLMTEVRSLLARNFAGYRYGLTTALNAELMFSGNVTSGSYPYQLYGTITHYNHPKWYEHFVRSGLQANWGWAYVTQVSLTVDELILNRAEAYTYLGQYDRAISDLNQFASSKIMNGSTANSYNPSTHGITETKIKNFYKTDDLKEGLIKTILDFKRREFMFEGLRYFDILRYKIPVVHVTYDNKNEYVLGPNDPRRAFQMPEEVSLSGIENNPTN